MPRWSRLSEQQRYWALTRGFDRKSWDRRHDEINGAEDIDFESSRNRGFDWDLHFAERYMRDTKPDDNRSGGNSDS